jgi:hypothetical protein
MAKQVFGHDPTTGVTDYLDIIEEGGQLTAVAEFVQDVQPLIDRNKELANVGATDIGVKKGLWHYCSIPMTVVIELRQKGVNVFNPDHHKRVFQEINQNYAYLKTTNKTHA